MTRNNFKLNEYENKKTQIRSLGFSEKNALKRQRNKAHKAFMSLSYLLLNFKANAFSCLSPKILKESI